MTKRHTKEVRPSPAERSPRTHATSSKPDQNEQNSKQLTDGAYFWFDGYRALSEQLFPERFAKQWDAEDDLSQSA